MLLFAVVVGESEINSRLEYFVFEWRYGPTKHRKEATKDLLNTEKYDKGLQIDLLDTAKSDEELGIIT